MKTYEEMAQSALDRIETHKTEQIRRRKTAVKIAVPAVCCCLAVILGIRFGKPGALPEPSTVTPAEPVSSEQSVQLDPVPEEPTAAPAAPVAPSSESAFVPAKPPVTPTEPVIPSESAIIPTVPVSGPPEPISVPTEPAPEPASGFESEPEPAASSPAQDGIPSVKPIVPVSSAVQLWWKNRLVMSGTLYHALEGNPGSEQEIAARFRPATAEITDFIYEGKTLSEWAIAATDAKMLPDKMTQLLKCGDELKYGTALYETGLPSGIKWDKRLYEDKVAFFGELLDKYIVNGEFLRSELEKDLAACKEDKTAEEQYRLAWEAYLDAALPLAVQKLAQSGISAERSAEDSAVLIFRAAEAQLEPLLPEDWKSWSFALAEDLLITHPVVPQATVAD